MSAKLILTRKGEWFNKRQNYKVFIDDNEVGTIKNESSEQYDLAPGMHTVQCRHNWMSSPVATVQVTESANTYLKVSNGMKYILPLYIAMLVGILFPVFFKFARIPIPDQTSFIKIILIFPALIYILVYLTLLRKKYLILTEVTGNLFTKS